MDDHLDHLTIIASTTHDMTTLPLDHVGQECLQRPKVCEGVYAERPTYDGYSYRSK